MKLRNEYRKGLSKLDKGLYAQANKDDGMPVNVWLEKEFPKLAGVPETIYQGKTNFEIIQMRNRMKAAGKTIPLTQFEKMLNAHDIIVGGANSDKVEKFFSTSDTAILFPEFVMQTVLAASIQKSLVQHFIAGVQLISGLSFRKIYLQDIDTDASNISMGRSSRGAGFRHMTAKVAKESVELRKFGVVFDCDYETIYDTPISIYALQIARIGMQIGADETSWMIQTLQDGDGNSNGLQSGQTKTTVTSGSVVKRDIITFAAALPMPYQLNVAVGPTTQVILYWDALSDLTNPSSQKAEVNIPFPKVFRWDVTGICESDMLLGVDSSLATTYVTNDSVTMKETDRIIDQQTVKTVISKRGTFNVNFETAIGALDITH